MNARASRGSWLALVTALGLGCGARPPAPAAPAEPLIGVWYTVAPGDTLTRIAAAHGVPVEDLVEINGLTTPDALVVGQPLFLYGIETLLARRPPEADEATPADATPAAGPPPFAWPVQVGVISSGFGTRAGRPHKGLDIAAKAGTQVTAAADGKVVYSDNKQRGYGNLVIIRHVRGYVTVYAHNRRNLVDEGERVRQGAAIAEVGSTGRSTGPHLHFEIREGGRAVDPLIYLPAR